MNYSDICELRSTAEYHALWAFGKRTISTRGDFELRTAMGEVLC